LLFAREQCGKENGIAREPEEREAPNAPAAAFSLEVGPLEEFPRDSIEPREIVSVPFTIYAVPLSWGQWVQVITHNGVVSYDIAYRAVRRDTVVHGCVYYYSSSGAKKEVFRDSIRITTGNWWASVYVCFYGNPYGSAVNGTITYLDLPPN
jgi:hypothetical protein